MSSITSSQFSSFTFGRSLFGGGPVDAVVSPSQFPGVEYVIEVTAPDGTLIVRLPNWFSGEVQEEVNVASIFRFKYPVIENITEHIDLPNVLILRDLRGTRIIQRFIIKRVEKVYEEGVDMVLITSASLITQLYDTVIQSYSTAPKPVIEIVDDLFTLGQVSSLHFPIVNGMDDGGINSKVNFVSRAKNVSIMNIIQKMWDTIGFFVYVTPGGVFKWSKTMPSVSNTSPFIRWGSNLPKLSTVNDYSEVYTKIIVEGGTILEDDPEAEGEVVDMLIEATAQSEQSVIDIYGLKLHPIIKDTNIQSVEQAQELADVILARVESPRRKIRAVAFDISKAISNEDFDHTQLRLGQEIKVIHPSFTNSPLLMISSRRYDLANSVMQNITLTDPVSVNPYIKPVEMSGGDDFTGGLPGDFATLEELIERILDRIEELARLIARYQSEWGIDDDDLFDPYDDEYRPYWQLLIRKKLSDLPTENTYEDANGNNKRADSAPLFGWAISQPDAYGAILNKLLSFIGFIFQANSVANLPTLGNAPDPTGGANTLAPFEQFPPKFGYIATGDEAGYYGLHPDASEPWKRLGGGGASFEVFDSMSSALVGVADMSPPQLIYLNTAYEGQKYFILGDGGTIIPWTHFNQTVS